MPKIIKNLRERILEAARETLTADGYRALSMRGLARRVGVAPGTLYNYFADKDELVATLSLADWRETLERMGDVAAAATELAPALAALCDEMCRFTARYRPTWEQCEQGAAAAYHTRYHRMLREQVAAPVSVALARAGRDDLAPTAGVLAEALLACAVNADLGTPALEGLASALDGAGAPHTHTEGGTQS